MYNIEFSNDELQALVQLLDVAVKTGGLSMAENAVVLYKKIQTSVSTEKITDDEPAAII